MKYMRRAQHHLFLLAFVRSFYVHSFLVQISALSMQRHYLHDIKGVTLTGLVDIVQPPEWMASYWSLFLTRHLMKWMLKHFPVRVSDIFLAKWVSRKNFGKLYIFVDIAQFMYFHTFLECHSRKLTYLCNKLSICSTNYRFILSIEEQVSWGTEFQKLEILMHRYWEIFQKDNRYEKMITSPKKICFKFQMW